MELIEIEEDITSSFNLLEEQDEQFVIYIRSNEYDETSLMEDDFIKDDIDYLDVAEHRDKPDSMLNMSMEEDNSPQKKLTSSDASLSSFLIYTHTSLPSIKKVEEISPKNKPIQKRPSTCQQILKPDVDPDLFDDIELEEEKEMHLYLESYCDNEVVQCPKCHAKFANKYILEIHYACHLVKPPYICPTCEKQSKNTAYLLQHFIQHTDFQFICQKCNTAFKVRDDFLKHAEDHPGGMEPTEIFFNSMVRTSTFKKLLHEFLIKQYMFKLNTKSDSPQKKLASSDDSLNSLLFIMDPTLLSSCKPHEAIRKKKKKFPRKKSPSASSQKLLRVDINFNFSYMDIELEEEKEIRLYLESYRENEVVQCPKCPIKFVNKCLLEQHYACHLVKPPFFCPLCGKLSKNTTCLLQHFRQHTDYPYICQMCNTAFKVEDDLKRHTLTHISGGKEYSEISLNCKLKTLTFKKLLHEFLIRQSSWNDGAIYHNYKQEEEEPISITEHLEHCIKKPVDPPLLQPQGNDVELDAERDLRLYLSNFSNKEVVKCMKCQVKFANKFLMEQHYVTHLIKPPLVCPVCERELKAVPSFISHLRHHSKSIGCHQCNVMFKLKRDLDQHLLTHLGDGPATAVQKNDSDFFKKIVHEFLFRQSQSYLSL